jgi:hypothetical protein
MPLEQGATSNVVSRNIAELLRSYKKTGKIGNTKPRSLTHARKIASAAAYAKSREK